MTKKIEINIFSMCILENMTLKNILFITLHLLFYTISRRLSIFNIISKFMKTITLNMHITYIHILFN